MPLALLGDAGRRRRIVLSGGMAFILAWLLTAGAWSFQSLLLAALLASPASGAFVSLAQASLMDVRPDAHERSMARWVVAGSVGVVAGPLVLAGSAAIGPGWRGAMLLLALGSVPVVLAARRLPLDRPTTAPPWFPLFTNMISSWANPTMSYLCGEQGGGHTAPF